MSSFLFLLTLTALRVSLMGMAIDWSGLTKPPLLALVAVSIFNLAMAGRSIGSQR